LTILVAILGLILLIVIHELGHMLVAKAMGVHVPEFGIGFGPALFKKKIGKTVYSFRIILLGGFARMKGMEGVASVEKETGEMGEDSYPSKPPWRRALIIFAGPFANLLAAVLIFAAVFMYGVQTGAETEIEQVVPGSLAADVGLRAGDTIVEAESEPVTRWEDFEEAIGGKRPGDEVAFAVQRGGERLEFGGALKPAPGAPERAIVGVQPVPIYTSYGPIEALGLGVKQSVQIIGLFGWFVGQLFTPDDPYTVSNSVSSPIGVVSITSDVASRGAVAFAQLLAFISLNLAVFNLLPILPLDGGHLFFIAAEKVLGRPVKAETMGKVAALGIALVLTLFLFATYTDLSKIITGQPFIPEQRP
jgi:regulator of sigma E protease